VAVIAIYTRLSSDPTGQQTSTARQERACREYATLRGWQVANVYEDVDTSAYNPKSKRPNFDRLMADLPGLDGVLVWRVDRLVRRSAEFERFWKRCEDHDAFLASVMEPIDTSSEMGIALVRILIVFAQLESAARSQRLRSKMAELARTGVPRGAPPYGFTDNWMTLVPDEAVLVREVAGRYLSGESFLQIATALNAQRRLTRASCEWTPEGLRRLVTNARNISMRSHRGVMVAAGAWPSILERDVFDAVVLRVESSRRATQPHAGLLTGWLTCAMCGGRMGSWRADGRHRYVCMNHAYEWSADYATCPSRVSISGPATEAWLLHHIVWRSRFTARWVPHLARLVPQPITLESWGTLTDYERSTVIEQHVARIEVAPSRPGVMWSDLRLHPVWVSEVPSAPPFKWKYYEVDRRLAASDEHVGAPEAARMIGVSKTEIYRYTRIGVLSPIQRVGRRLIYRTSDVEEVRDARSTLAQRAVDSRTSKRSPVGASGRRRDDIEDDKVLAAYAAGHSMIAVATALGTTKGTVKRRLARNGVPARVRSAGTDILDARARLASAEPT
jgi:DNA invertase Pin-like site-specific DNA recombinase